MNPAGLAMARNIYFNSGYNINNFTSFFTDSAIITEKRGENTLDGPEHLFLRFGR